ncbi:MFS transporter [Tenuibacillus multivorans]|uniref:Major Facilitator Superfamily protein n=1 Tax=Tenuibacillus multivorans TaxID=237069 RepID=A0A1H0E387_9BACI|nr:MFS transporter [Tenuibacillus multivorans]GEL76672.1 MFS transporter [Tenuibacillus multivorans]SDN76796.1 Major Facilitator Superfamily protein [Tenuibacillus multivorans]
MYNRRNINILITDNAISIFSSTFGTFLISWILYELTGSKFAMGGLWLLTITTQILIQFICAPYMDKWPKIKVMILSESFRLIAFTLLLFNFFFGWNDIFIFYSAVLLNSVTLFEPALNSIIPSIVNEGKLVMINSKIASINQLVRFIAYPLAGVIIGIIGTNNSIVLLVIISLISITLLMQFKYEIVSGQLKEKWWNQFKKGLDVYKHNKILIFMGVLIAVTNFGVFATISMHVPYVNEILNGGSFEYGLFAGSFPLGYIVMSFIIGKVNEPKYKLSFMMLALFIGGLTFLGLGYTNILGVAILLEFIAGCAMPMWNIYSTTIYQKLAPENYRGQVFTVRSIIATAATPFGIIYGSIISSLIGLPFMYISIGILTCFTSLLGIIILSYKMKNKSNIKYEVG